jgi:hypothetical protein
MAGGPDQRGQALRETLPITGTLPLATLRPTKDQQQVMTMTGMKTGMSPSSLELTLRIQNRLKQEVSNEETVVLVPLP